MPKPWDDAFETIVRNSLPHLPPGTTIAVGTGLRDCGLDSISTIELVMALEERYRFTFADCRLTGTTFATAGSLWTAMQAERAGGHRRSHATPW